MGELTSALDSLGADNLHAMFGPQLLARLGELLRIQNRLAAEILRTVRECEVTDAAEVDGLKSTASWLRGHGRLSTHAAAELVHTSRALEHLPRVTAAFASFLRAGSPAWALSSCLPSFFSSSFFFSRPPLHRATSAAG